MMKSESGRKFRSGVLILAILFCVSWVSQPARADENGMAFKPAPEWTVLDWLNSPELSVEMLRDHVVIVEFFDMDSPECQSFSLPLMYHWGRMFSKYSDVFLLSIHSVVRKQERQDTSELRGFLLKNGISRPVGIDAHFPGNPEPITLQELGAKKTPTIVILDKKGNIRFQQTGAFNFRNIEPLIRRLREEDKVRTDEN